MPTVTLRYYAGARAAAGITEEVLELPPGSTVHDAITAVAEHRGATMASVLAACSFLLDGVAVRDHDSMLNGATQLDVLPPFAGG